MVQQARHGDPSRTRSPVSPKGFADILTEMDEDMWRRGYDSDQYYRDIGNSERDFIEGFRAQRLDDRARELLRQYDEMNEVRRGPEGEGQRGRSPLTGDPLSAGDAWDRGEKTEMRIRGKFERLPPRYRGPFRGM